MPATKLTPEEKAQRRAEAAAEINADPGYWFLVMEAEKRKGNFTAAADAKAKMEALGVRVTYIRSKPRKITKVEKNKEIIP